MYTRIGLVLLLMVGMFMGLAMAEPAPSMYFAEDIVLDADGTGVLELRVATTDMTLGVEAELPFNPVKLTITDIDFADSPWQPLAEDGWSLYDGYAKFSTANFGGVAAGDYLIGYVTVQAVMDDEFRTNIQPRNMVPSNSIGYSVDILYEGGEPAPTPTPTPTPEPTPSPDNTVTYTVTVKFYEGQDTIMKINAAAFGTVYPNEAYGIPDSLTFINTGAASAYIYAAFTTQNDYFYGFMTENYDGIPAEYFYLNEKMMNNDGSPAVIGQVGPQSDMTCSAMLFVPDDIVEGDYEGTVKLAYD